MMHHFASFALLNDSKFSLFLLYDAQKQRKMSLKSLSILYYIADYRREKQRKFFKTIKKIRKLSFFDDLFEGVVEWNEV